MPLVLGVLLGPHATEAQVRDADSGALVGSSVVRHAELGPHEEDPTAWWRSLAAAIARAGERHVAALSVVGAHPGLVLADDAGVVLRPMQPWDAAEADVRRLVRTLGAERWARRAGAIPDATTTVTRLSWLRRADPATFARIGAVLLPHDWLTYRLVGKPVTDRGSASQTGLWSPHTGLWIPDVLALLASDGRVVAWGRRLPEVVEPSARADWLDAPVHDLLGLRGRPVVGPGTGEAMAVALALGLRPGQVGVALGHRTTVLAPLARPIVDPSGAVRSRADATGGHLAVAEAAGGATLVSAMAELLDQHVTDFGLSALRASPGTDDVVVLPGLDERPGAIVTGVSASTRREDLARATFEGVAAAALAAADRIMAAGGRWDDDEPLRLTGPAAGLDAHAQMTATLASRPVVAVPGSLAAAGACVQAAAVLQEVAPEAVAEAWALGEGVLAEPEDDPFRAHRRAVHAEEHERQARAWSGDTDG
ncbi:MAG: FGGY family carbohydrate kinase [Acidimicrobiales bacterium]|nr:FGGY family carbohydrate kinase [Acidimicrobiales bacterium]